MHMSTFSRLRKALVSAARKTGFCLALAGLSAPGAHAQAPTMADFVAERAVIAEALREVDSDSKGELLQTFVEIPFSQRAFPGDVGNLQAFNQILDHRAPYQQSQANLAAVQRWYDAQIPFEYLRKWRNDGDQAGDLNILYLTRCRAGNLGEGVQLDLGDRSAYDLNSVAYEQARIALALEGAGISVRAVPFFRTGGSGNRTAPDPRIAAFNRQLLARNPDDPHLVLEGFCGQLPDGGGVGGVVAAGLIGPPQYYQLKFPAGVTSGRAAPLLYANICLRKTGSLINTSCRAWESVAPGVPKTGRGRFRLVARVGDRVETFVYEVLERNLASGGMPEPVIPVREGP